MKHRMGKFKTLFLFGLLTLLLSGCGKDNLTALVPKGYGSESSMNLIILTTVVMSFVFLVVIVALVIVLLRFRESKRGKDFIPKQVEGSQALETIWTVIPIILVVIMAVPTVIATFDLADTSEASEHINVNVTGNQFWWHFDYEDEGVQTSQDLYIPVGERVYLNLISDDVTHSFWVPTITGKMDANPENTNVMYIEAYEEGVYWGKCAEFCGPSHSLMDFKVIAVSPDEYDEWIADMSDADQDEVPDDAVAAEGKELFEEKSCMGCHALDSSTGQSGVGPNLANFGNRTTIAGILEPTKDNLVDWILDPESIKPGNLMTGKYGDVSEDEADKIAEYLMQLKETDITAENAGDLEF